MGRSERLQTEIAERLGRYVYALVDPRDGVPFYIGKGTGDRVLQHGWDADALSEDADATVEHAKLLRIEEIREEHLEVDVWILRSGMKPAEYSAVEATVIDLFRTFPVVPLVVGAKRSSLIGGVALTNKVRGENVANGIQRLSDMVRDFSAPDLEVQEPLLLITLGDWVDAADDIPGAGHRSGHGFKLEWTDSEVLRANIDELGKSTCCWWHLDRHKVDRLGIRHMVAVYGGVTRGLFEIIDGSGETVPAVTRTGKPTTRSGYAVRPVLDGELFDKTVGEYGHRTPAKKRGEQGSVRYWPYLT